MLEVGSSAIAVFPMRLQSAVALWTAHVLTPTAKRLCDPYSRPDAVLAHLTLVDLLAHADTMAWQGEISMRKAASAAKHRESLCGDLTRAPKAKLACCIGQCDR